MVRYARKFDFRPTPGANRTRFHLALLICMLVLFGPISVRAASGDEVGKGIARAPIPGAQIAIADFDGDQYLDWASVQPGASDGTRTNYSIRLRFTAAAGQSIELLAPAGGLEISARDVNGDSAVDLVLTASWLKQPVAVLLNDGHGNFSRIDPSEYPDAFHDSNAISDSPSSGRSVAPIILSKWRAEICALETGAWCAPTGARLSRIVDSGAALSSPLTSTRCRAPPAGPPNL